MEQMDDKKQEAPIMIPKNIFVLVSMALSMNTFTDMKYLPLRMRSLMQICLLVV